MEQVTPQRKLRLLHITDSHLDDKTTVSTVDIKTPVDGLTQPLRSGVLRDTIRNLAKSLKDNHQMLDAVVVSGDSALKGDPSGQISLRSMLLDLLADVGVTASNIVVTPGNHDVIAGSMPSAPERYDLFVNAWRKPTPAIIPFLDGIHDIEKLDTSSHVLVEPNRDWAIFPINSANWSQLLLPPEKNPHIALLLDHLKTVADPKLDNALEARLPPGPQCRSEFVQRSTQPIHLHGTEFDQERSHPVQAEHRLLVFRLCHHRAHSRLIGCHPDRPSARRIGLVGLNERPNKFCVRQNFNSRGMIS